MLYLPRDTPRVLYYSYSTRIIHTALALFNYNIGLLIVMHKRTQIHKKNTISKTKPLYSTVTGTKGALLFFTFTFFIVPVVVKHYQFWMVNHHLKAVLVCVSCT